MHVKDIALEVMENKLYDGIEKQDIVTIKL